MEGLAIERHLLSYYPLPLSYLYSSHTNDKPIKNGSLVLFFFCISPNTLNRALKELMPSKYLLNGLG